MKHTKKRRRLFQMKKVFVEPEMRKIELNLSENIATSVEQSMGYLFFVTLFSCTIQDTGKLLIQDQVTEAEAENCRINANARVAGRIVPQKDVRPYFSY